MSDALSDLAAKVAALEMIVELLLVDYLADDKDPAELADMMVKNAFANEKKVRDLHGDHPAAMTLTEALSSLIDRALPRAVAEKNRRRSSP